MIAAMTKNHVIGNKGKIPWKIPGEQKRFKNLTLGKTVIMGRISYEEIGKPLSGRKTIVISNSLLIQEENCITVSTLTEAIELTKGEAEIFIAGGGSVYKEALPFTDRIYLTIIEMETEGDIFFPLIPDEFHLVSEEKIDGEIPYTYYTYDRIKI